MQINYVVVGLHMRAVKDTTTKKINKLIRGHAFVSPCAILERALYTTLPIHLSIPMARIRHSVVKLRIERARWNDIAREDSICACGEGMETVCHWHASLLCEFNDAEKDIYMGAYVSETGSSEFELSFLFPVFRAL